MMPSPDEFARTPPGVYPVYPHIIRRWTVLAAARRGPMLCDGCYEQGDAVETRCRCAPHVRYCEQLLDLRYYDIF